MKQEAITEEQKTENLIGYLDFLLQKNHIEIRSTLDRYRQKLLFGDQLRKTEFETLLKFMVRDFSYTKKQLRDAYKYLIVDQNQKPTKEDRGDLSAFFV